MSDREVQCEGLGLGITVNERELFAFIAIGEEAVEGSPTHIVRLPLERLNKVIVTMISIANELAGLDMEMSAVPPDDREAFFAKLCARYSAGSN
jgi:hypothetical protein